MPWAPPKSFKPTTGWEKPRYEIFTWPAITEIKAVFPPTPHHVEIGAEIAQAGEAMSLREAVDTAVVEQAHRYDPEWVELWTQIAIEYAKRLERKELASRKRTDALQTLIYKALGEDPKVTTEAVLQALKRKNGQGVIEGVVEGVIEWTDKGGQCKETPVSALAKRVSRARKQLKNSR